MESPSYCGRDQGGVSCHAAPKRIENLVDDAGAIAAGRWPAEFKIQADRKPRPSFLPQGAGKSRRHPSMPVIGSGSTRPMPGGGASILLRPDPPHGGEG